MEGRNVTAPGRYCLAVCYCGDCDHYKPIPPPRGVDVAPKPVKTTWDDRKDSTWIDKL
jgi:hypothetical protein